MIYLIVEHTDDEDFDYYKFLDLDTVISYIKDEDMQGYTVSDKPINIPEDDYIYVEVRDKYDS